MFVALLVLINPWKFGTFLSSFSVNSMRILFLDKWLVLRQQHGAVYKCFAYTLVTVLSNLLAL